jgi:hypothetical protein
VICVDKLDISIFNSERLERDCVPKMLAKEVEKLLKTKDVFVERF